MCEIIFRGKRSDTGDWVKGFYIKKAQSIFEELQPIRHCIIDLSQFGYDVDPETVGQFTGLFDKNGKQIFEGDIVSTLSGKTFEVKFELGSFYLSGSSIAIYHAIRFTVVGNRWDNPELLEEVTNND